MKIHIKTGNGDNPLPEIVDALIFTRNEAIMRGRKELVTSKQVSEWTITISFREGIRRGIIFMADCPEAGVFFEPMIIVGYKKDIDNGAKAIIELKCKTYKPWEVETVGYLSGAYGAGIHGGGGYGGAF